MELSENERRETRIFIPKKTGRPKTGRPVEGNKVESIAVVLFLVAGIAIGTADCRTACRSDGRTFKSTAGLVTDDTAEDGSAEGACGCSALGVWTYRCCAIGKSEACYCADDG